MRVAVALLVLIETVLLASTAVHEGLGQAMFGLFGVPGKAVPIFVASVHHAAGRSLRLASGVPPSENVPIRGSALNCAEASTEPETASPTALGMMADMATPLSAMRPFTCLLGVLCTEQHTEASSVIVPPAK